MNGDKKKGRALFKKSAVRPHSSIPRAGPNPSPSAMVIVTKKTVNSSKGSSLSTTSAVPNVRPKKSLPTGVIVTKEAGDGGKGSAMGTNSATDSRYSKMIASIGKRPKSVPDVRPNGNSEGKKAGQRQASVKNATSKGKGNRKNTGNKTASVSRRPATVCQKPAKASQGGDTIDIKRKGLACQHDQVSSLQFSDNSSYFTIKYIQGRDNWPEKCCGCDAKFGSDYKVGSGNAVWLCPKAEEINDECTFAYCNGCYIKKMDEKSEKDENRRSRRQRR